MNNRRPVKRSITSFEGALRKHEQAVQTYSADGESVRLFNRRGPNQPLSRIAGKQRRDLTN